MMYCKGATTSYQAKSRAFAQPRQKEQPALLTHWSTQNTHPANSREDQIILFGQGSATIYAKQNNINAS
jgi:hypothetical protein